VTAGLVGQVDARLHSVRRRVRSASYLRKWVVLGALIGVVGGLGAILFFTALQFATHFFLGVLVGFTPPTPSGEGAAPITDAARPWALPLVVGLGGLLSGILVFRFAPEAEGHGTDAAIAAFHHDPRGIRARIPAIKLVASALTIGSGGSGGREGPTAQISAGFGSFLGRALDLDARDARIAVAVGMAAGIGAIFRAPLGGAILGAELLYRDDVESEALVPSFIATIVAYTIFGAVEGFSPIFGTQARFGFTDPAQLGWYALIGLVCGLVGLLYINNFYGLTERFGQWNIPRALKPAIAGVMVGCIGIFLPGVLGTGYGWVQAGFDRQALLAIPLWIILVLPFAKILATSLSIGSGGSGGIFGPGMVVGGLLGAGIWRLLVPVAPAVPVDPAPFVIVAMMALFGSVAHAPLAVMLMVAEMTGNLSMLAPAMVAVGLATFVVGRKTIYRSQLATRADSPAHRFRFAMPLLAAVPVGDSARQPRLVVGVAELVGSVRARMEAIGVPGAPVLGRDGSVAGMIDLDALLTAPDEMRIADTRIVREPILRADDGLDDALGALADHGRSWAPVAAGRRLVGTLSVRDAMTAYRTALHGNIRQVRGVRAGGVILEAEIAPGSALAGHRVADIDWPREAVLVAIERGGELLVPRGDLVVTPGDHISIFATPEARPLVEALLEVGEVQVVLDVGTDSAGSDSASGPATGRIDPLDASGGGNGTMGIGDRTGTVDRTGTGDPPAGAGALAASGDPAATGTATSRAEQVSDGPEPTSALPANDGAVSP
jgi:CIC family chloride channel protein